MINDRFALVEALRREAEILIESYNIEIERGIVLLQNAGSRKPSDHLGHNLANVATTLSSLAGQLAQNAKVLFTLEATRPFAEQATK